MKKLILIGSLIVLFSNSATYLISAIEAHARAEEEFYRGAAVVCAEAYIAFTGAPPTDAWNYCRDDVSVIVDMDIYGTHPTPGWVWPPIRQEGE